MKKSNRLISKWSKYPGRIRQRTQDDTISEWEPGDHSAHEYKPKRNERYFEEMEESFGIVCYACNGNIPQGTLYAYVNGHPMHAACLSCFHCQTSLCGRDFVARDKKFFCLEHSPSID
ncbi:unnamed protein product [Calicophoron daubneyi]|uniref:LIM zinc-binding domain-containing protein n=1 Tax=Calicophoron daubneyi TaxID=300641 RepID=A0AAV2TKY2_CALDB